MGRLAGLHEAPEVASHLVAHPFGQMAHRIAHLAHVRSAGKGRLAMAHLVELGDLLVDRRSHLEDLPRRRIPAQRPAGEQRQQEDGSGGQRAPFHPTGEIPSGLGAPLGGSKGAPDFTSGQRAHDRAPGNRTASSSRPSEGGRRRPGARFEACNRPLERPSVAKVSPFRGLVEVARLRVPGDGL